MNNNQLELDDILNMYSDLIKKYNNINKRSAVADKQLAKFMSEYAELLLKKNGDLNSNININTIEPIKIEVIKSKKK